MYHCRYGCPRAATVIALDDGKLWCLDRLTFRKLIHISDDTRKQRIKILRHVPTFTNMSTIQIQSLADVLQEESYSEKDNIIQEGRQFNATEKYLYIVKSGTCDISYVEDASVSKLYSLREYDIFSDDFLLSTGKTVNVIATSAVQLCILKCSDFKSIVGSMDDIQYSYASHSHAVSESEVIVELDQKCLYTPDELANTSVVGMISVDEVQLGANTGTSLCLGVFQTESVFPNVTLHSIIFSKLKGTKREHVEILRNIQSSSILTVGAKLQNFVPQYLGLYQQHNVLHFVYKTTISSDLSNILHSKPDIVSRLDVLQYIMAVAVRVMQHIHGAGVVFRNIQPEGLHVDNDGRLVFIDFRLSKSLQSFNGMVTGKTYTLCGAAEYIAPEQLQAGGYNNSVDYWALGVLLCELASRGVNPFAVTDSRPSNSSSHSETAVFSRIMSYGQEEFPALSFSESVPEEVQDLATELLKPAPYKRLGVRDIPNSVESYKFFNDFDWTQLDSMNSPLRAWAMSEISSILSEGPKTEITAMWDEKQSSVPDWVLHLQ